MPLRVLERNSGILLLVLGIGLSAQSGRAAERYVNPSHPAAADAGSGDAARPYKTLAYAISQLATGDTMVIAEGVYRETLDLGTSSLTRQPRNSDGGAKQTVIEAAAAARVTIKGSDLVSGWEALGDGLFVKREWPVNSQQVFVDGTPMLQIGGTVFGGYPEVSGHALAGLHRSEGGIWPGRQPGGIAQLVANSFYYDAKASVLYVKTALASLSGHQVEVSVRTHALIGRNIDHLSVKGIGFEHANTSSSWHTGAIVLEGDHLLLDHVDVTYADSAGLDISGDDNAIVNSTAKFCGQVGMKVKGDRARLQNNETSYNNTRGFNKWWEAGGAKFVGGGLRNSEVVGHRAYGNNGDGIWFDWLNRNNRIHEVVSAYNSGFGIHYEASQAAYIYDNYVFGNKERGIYLPHSSQSLVTHNLVAGNGLEGIVVIDEGRRDNETGVDLTPRGNRIYANIVAWNSKPAVILPAARLDNSSDQNLYITADAAPAFALGWPSFLNPVKSGLPQWRKDSGQDAKSWNRLLPVSAALAQALAVKTLKPDWSSLLNLAFQGPRAGIDAQGSVSAPDVTVVRPGPAR